MKSTNDGRLFIRREAGYSTKNIFNYDFALVLKEGFTYTRGYEQAVYATGAEASRGEFVSVSALREDEEQEKCNVQILILTYAW